MLKGNHILSASFRGNYVLLDFWNTYCGPCLGEIPYLQEAHEVLRSKNLEVVGMVFNDSEQNIAAAVHERNITWAQVLEPSGETSERFKVRGIPDPVLIGPNGSVLERGSRLSGNELLITLNKYVR